VVRYTPQLLYTLRKSPRYTLEWRLGGPKSWYGRGGKKKKNPIARNRTPVVQLIA